MRVVYAGWDDAKVLLLGTALMAEADSGPFMTSGPAPYGSSMAISIAPLARQPRRVVAGVRTPMVLGMDTYCRSVATTC